MSSRNGGSLLTSPDVERLEQEVRILRERVAFYEGFDRLIQENVAHSRELLRLAAQEKESASRVVENDRSQQTERTSALGAELAAICKDLRVIAVGADSLAQRIATMIPETFAAEADSGARAHGERPISVVAHGITSATHALSLQSHVAGLPQVVDVLVREFAGGLLRMDVRARSALAINQILEWEQVHNVISLTERSDVIEFAIGNGSM